MEKVLIEKSTQARDNKLTIEDMAGGTFTISNVGHWWKNCLGHFLIRVQGGVFGSLMGTPIINLPQTGTGHQAFRQIQ